MPDTGVQIDKKGELITGARQYSGKAWGFAEILLPRGCMSFFDHKRKSGN